MTIDNLETGMYAKTRNGKLWLIVIFENNPYLIHPRGWMLIQSIPQVSRCSNEFDILTIYKWDTNENKVFLFQYDIMLDLIKDGISFKIIYSNEESVIQDYKIPGTKLPTIPKNTEYRCRKWSKGSSFTVGTYTNFYSYGFEYINNEIYILAEEKHYPGPIFFMFKLSDLNNLPISYEK
jgi:hypothetical protein